MCSVASCFQSVWKFSLGEGTFNARRLFEAAVRARESATWEIQNLEVVAPVNSTGYRAFEKNLIETFSKICEHACDMIKVDHSGFVLFDDRRESGQVVAQYPQLDGLLGRTVPLRGVPAEEDFLESNKPIVIANVEKARELGEVRDLLMEFEIKSICIVMVYYQDTAVGSFSFDSIKQHREFTPADIERCRSFAQLAQTMIENARLVDWFESFQVATTAIASESNPDRLLNTIVKQANLLFGGQSVGLYQRQHDNHGVESLRLSASTDADLIGHLLPKGEGMAWRLVEGTDPFLRTDDYASYENRALKLGERFGSVVEVPLIRQSERVGVIYLSDERGRHFTKEEAAFLQRFADMATLALQNSSLVKRMERLSSVAADLSGYLDANTLDDKLTAIARHATTILNAEMCGVLTRDEPEFMVLKASHGHAPGAFQKDARLAIRNKPQSGLTGAIAWQLIRDFEQGGEASFREAGDVILKHPAVRGQTYAGPEGMCHSLLAIPLVHRGEAGRHEVIGMLRISNKKGVDGRPRDSVLFNDEDVWILRIFAEAAVVALESAKLVDELRVQRERYRDLYDAWNKLVSDAPLEDRLRDIASGVVRIVRKSFCRILLSKESRNYLTVEAAELHPDCELVSWNPHGRETTPISDWPLLEQALRDGKPYELSHPANTLQRLSDLLELQSSESSEPVVIQSMFSVPLIVGEHPVGLLSVGEFPHKDGEASGFTDNDRDFVRSIARQASVMIDREWRQKQREELLARVPEALARIRVEADSKKDLSVIAEHVRAVFGCGDAGFLIQRAAGLPIELITATAMRFEVPPGSPKASMLAALIASSGSIEDRAVITDSVENAITDLGLLSPTRFMATVRLEFAGARGLLFIADDHPRHMLRTADLGVLERLADHCATSFTKASANDQLDRARQGVLVVAVDLAIGDQRALENVVKGIRSATGSDIVTLYRTRPSDGEIIGAATAVGLRSEEPTVRPSKDSAVGRVLEKNEFHDAEDAINDPILGGTFVKRENVRSSIGAPVWLMSADGSEAKLTVGVLFVNYRTQHKFTKEDKDIIKMFSHLAAVAIRNQDVFERERRKAQAQAALREAAATLTEVADVETTVKRIAQEAYKVAQACGGEITSVAIGLLNDEASYRKVCTSPPEDWEDRGNRVREIMSLTLNSAAAAGVVATAFATGQPQLSIKTESTPGAFVCIHDHADVQLAIPISDGQRRVGIIYVEGADGSAFSEAAIETFELLAPLAFDALRAAKQYEELDTARLREEALTDVALFYIKSGVIVHRHRAAVRNFVVWENMFRQDAEREKVSKRLRKDFELVSKSAKQLNDILNSTNMDFAALPVLAINTLLRDWHDRLRTGQSFAYVETPFDIDRTRGAEVRVDSDLMREVFNIFATNSLTAMKSRPAKKFSVTSGLEPEGNKCRIVIADNGVGMAPEIAERIRKNIRSTSANGRGIGLLTAELIVTKFGGEMREPRTSPGGTVFTITLPLSGEAR